MQELASIQLVLRSHRNAKLPVWLGQAAHAIFMRTLEKIHPALSNMLHEAPHGVMPFTTSSLNNIDTQKTFVQLNPGQDVTLRYTTFQHQLTGLMLNGMMPLWKNDGINLHDQQMEVRDIYIERNQHPQAVLTAYETLLNEAQNKATITLNFASPTVFKSSGRSIPMPEPRLVFGSLIQRWNAYAPLLMPDDLQDIVTEYVTVEQFDMHTESIRVKKRYSVIGFVGQVTFRVHSHDMTLRQYLHTLASFAEFSGIGARTAVGLGQAFCERV